jgi:hypothetical protein
MPDQTITFNFAGSGSQLVSETKRIEKELKDLDAQGDRAAQNRTQSHKASAAAAEQNAKSTATVGQGVTELASRYFLVLQALQAVISVGKGAYDGLIGQNVELQQQLSSTQAALASTNQVFSGGIQLTDPTEAIKALEGPVNEAIARIREGSLDLVGVTSAELVPIYQNIAGQIGQLGGGLNDAADLTLKFAAALGTFNIPLAQQRQETSSILQGNITMDSVLAKNLNITNDQVRQWKAQGTAVAELNKRLETSAAANKLNSQTITGYASNIKEIFQNITLAAGKDLTAEITADLGQFYDFLVKNKDEIQKFVTEGADALLFLIRNFKDAGFAISDNLGPVAEQLGPIFEKLGPIFETVVLGLEKIAIKAAELVESNPALKVFLAIANGALTAVQALGSLNGEYAAGTEAAEIYGQRSSAVAQEAVDALGKIKRGEGDATAAKKEAIAKINDQLKALKESNVTGAENRAVVRSQIAELETYKGKLESSGGAIKLVSKDTTQLTSDLKLLTETFDAQGKAAELAQAQLTAAAKRSRTGDNGKATSAREEQTQLYGIEQEGLNKRLQLAQEKADGIAAIAAKGGDVEQQKEFAKQLTAAQTEQAALEGQIAEKSLARKKGLQDLQLKDLETAQGKAADAIAASESAQLLQIEQGYQADLTQKQRYELLKLGAAQDRIQAEIEAEKDRAAALSALKFDDPDEREANQAKIRASVQKTAALTLKALENQRQIEQGIAEFKIKQLSDQAAAEKRSFDARKQQLTEEQAGLDAIAKSIERQTQLRTAQTNLAKAQSDLLTATGQIEVDKLNRALEIRKKLDDPNTPDPIARVLRQQLEALSGNRNASELKLIQERIAAENQLQAIKKTALLAEQDTARANLAIEGQKNQLAAKRLVIETQIAEVNAKTALGEARKQLATLQQTPGADKSAIADAQQAVTDAQGNVDQAAQVTGAARANLAEQEPLAKLAAQTLTAQQQAALAQLDAANYAREQANQLTIVEAKLKAIALGQKGAGLTPDDFRQIQPSRTQVQPTGAQPLRTSAVPYAPAALPSATPAGPIQGSDQLNQLKELIQINRTQAELNQQAVGHLSAIASRRPAPVQAIVKPTATAPPYTSNQGLPI